MRAKILVAITLLALTAGMAQAQNAQDTKPNRDQGPAQTANSTDRITRETRHALAMLPYYSVFDWMQFQVQGNTVTLMGDVRNATLKSDAENTVKKVEGVEKVVNKINVLPPSPTDDRIRIAVFHAIFDQPGMERYAMGVQPPIHIIVNNGHVKLVGYADSAADKQRAYMAARGVSGTIGDVENDIQVLGQTAA